LYAWVYTVLKRRHIVNTWVGAVVGAIPPLMGWAACGGALLPSNSTPISLYFPPFLTNTSILADLSHYTNLVSVVPLVDNPLAPLALFLFHYAWQFPHFNSLSHFTRSGYAQAGYHMLSVLDPTKNALVALRHSVLLTALSCTLIPLSGLTTWWFVATSLVPNAILLNWSWKFWRNGGEKMARGLWGASLWYLPVMLGLMMYHKRGMEWLNWLGLKEVEAGEGAKEEKIIYNIEELILLLKNFMVV
jgi:heme o synthase